MVLCSAVRTVEGFGISIAVPQERKGRTKSKKAIVFGLLDATGRLGKKVQVGRTKGPFHADVEGQRKELVSIQRVAITVPFWEGPHWRGVSG